MFLSLALILSKRYRNVMRRSLTFLVVLNGYRRLEAFSDVQGVLTISEAFSAVLSWSEKFQKIFWCSLIFMGAQRQSHMSRVVLKGF